MKIKKFPLLIFLLVACLSCDRSNDSMDSLKGTKWKLAGYPNYYEEKMEIPEPKGCAGCYTLKFDSDYTATFYSITGKRKIDLMNLNPDMAIATRMWWEKYGKDGKMYDVSNFFAWLAMTESYTVTSSDLKLFFKTRICTDCEMISFYLHFKRI